MFLLPGWLFVALALWVAIYGSCFLVAIYGSCFPGGNLWLLLSGWLFMVPASWVAIYGSCFPGGNLWLLVSGWPFMAPVSLDHISRQKRLDHFNTPARVPKSWRAHENYFMVRGYTDLGRVRLQTTMKALAAAHANTFGTPVDIPAEVLAKCASYFEKEAAAGLKAPVRSSVYASKTFAKIAECQKAILQTKDISAWPNLAAEVCAGGDAICMDA